jgi:hypothetical protein
MTPQRRESAGSVGVVSNDTGRFTVFTASMVGLEMPPGSGVIWASGSDIVLGRNSCVERMRGEWLWFMDDDHAFEPGLLMQLLSHNVDVVVPVCLMRQKPFFPVELTAEGQALDLTTAPRTGLVELYAAGTAGMLIRRRVFERLEPPYFAHGDTSEDFIFCARLRELGIPIHCDLGARLGHVTTTVIWPDVTAGPDPSWCVGFQVSDSYMIQVGIEKE